MTPIILFIILITTLLIQTHRHSLFYKRENEYKPSFFKIVSFTNLLTNLVIFISLYVIYNGYGLITLFVLILIFSLLNHLSIEDLFFQEISFYVVIFMNIILFLARLMNLIPFYSSHSMSNFVISGFICASSTYLLFRVTKTRGLGEGDIYLAFFVGMLFGLNKRLVVFFYVMIISASLVGISYALKRKQFKNLSIPLVPFIAFSTYVTIFFSDQILYLYERLLIYFLT